jgi:ketosteroid isomerase-like protein
MALPLEEWAQRYARAWEGADADEAAALFTEDATYRANPFEEPYRGRDGIRRYWREVTATQAGVTVEIGRTLSEGSRALVEWWTRMDSDGTPVTLPGALLLDLDENGLCTALREYWNLEVGRRLGPPDGWGT